MENIPNLTNITHSDNELNKDHENDNKTVKAGDKEIPEDELPREIAKDTVIRILSILIAVLLTYTLVSRYIVIKNSKLSEEYTVFSTEFSTEEQTTAALRVNINTDNIYELTLLPGIGLAKAQNIFDYRKENGDFTSIEELKEVHGIGDSTYEKLKDMIYVE